MQFLTENDRDVGIENIAYEIWEQQDQVLLTWLHLTLLKMILSRVLGCTYSNQLWEKIHEYFHLQTRAQARQLRMELRRRALDNNMVETQFVTKLKSNQTY